jgi:hypothetical protein
VGWFFVGLVSASVGRRPNSQKSSTPSCGLSATIPGANGAINQFLETLNLKPETLNLKL